jgi:hypothetical protein
MPLVILLSRRACLQSSGGDHPAPCGYNVCPAADILQGMKRPMAGCSAASQLPPCEAPFQQVDTWSGAPHERSRPTPERTGYCHSQPAGMLPWWSHAPCHGCTRKLSIWAATNRCLLCGCDQSFTNAAPSCPCCGCLCRLACCCSAHHRRAHTAAAPSPTAAAPDPSGPPPFPAPPPPPHHTAG